MTLVTNFDDLMKNWEKALEAYGTPGDFADSVFIELLEPSHVEDISWRSVTALGYSRRKELIENQKRNTEERKLRQLPPRWKNDLHPCFLCDNVGQASDTGDNLMIPFDTYKDHVLLPNRYPNMRGHVLLVAKEHDPEGKKVLMTVTPSYLETVVDIAGRYNLRVGRNHAKAGMSKDDHEHCHLSPSRVIIKDGERIYLNGLVDCGLVQTDYGRGIFFVERTRFDTIAFQNNAMGGLLEAMGKLEEEDYIFTLSYHSLNFREGVFFLTPHIKQDPKGRVSHGDPIYTDTVAPDQKRSYEDRIHIAEEHLPKRGSFPWNRYFE